MLYTKTISLSEPVAFLKLAHYLQNQAHPHHQEYKIEKLRSPNQQLTAENFLPLTLAAMERHNHKRRGRPIQNIATLHIVRTLDGSDMSDVEREQFAREYINRIAPDGNVLYTWHINWGLKCEDLNVLVPGVTSFDRPRARRQRGVNPITEARDTADAITELINQERREQQVETIVTMPERQRQIVAERRGACLEQQLAALPERVTLGTLKAAIEKLGHEVTRFSPDKDYCSVLFSRDDSSDTPATKRRATRFKLFDLLDTVDELRQEREHPAQHLAVPAPVPSQHRAEVDVFRAPKYAELQRLIQGARCRRSTPSDEPPQSPVRSR